MSHEDMYLAWERDQMLIEQLRQALWKCSPFTDYNENEVEICFSCCIPYYLAHEHADNCEYIKLIGGNENERD